MTLSDITTLHAYSSWATNRFFDVLEKLTPEQLAQDMRVSHGSIHGTLLHMIGAEKIWLERWKGETPKGFLSAAEAPDLAALKQVWTTTGKATAAWLGTLNDKKLQESFTMTTAAGKSFTHAYVQAFQHLVNHSTYHRGQITALLRQLGVAPPATDLIVFFRETAR
jgi:uncharacterized damage-inducible protein DinB